MPILSPQQWYQAPCRECKTSNQFSYREGFCFVRCQHCGQHIDVRNVDAPVTPYDVSAVALQVKMRGVEPVMADARVEPIGCPDAMTQLESVMEVLNIEDTARDSKARTGSQVGAGVQKAMETWGFIADIGDFILSRLFGEPDFTIGNGVRIYINPWIPGMRVWVVPPTGNFALAPVLMIVVLLLSVRGYMYFGLCAPSSLSSAASSSDLALAQWCSNRFDWLYITCGAAVCCSFGLLLREPGYLLPDLNAKPLTRHGPKSDHPLEMMRVAAEDDAASPIEYETVDGVALERRWCRVCNILRPVRSAHCYICGLCVRSQDHHCHVTGTDIGQRNAHIFVGFVTLLAISCVNGYSLMLYYLYKLASWGFLDLVVSVMTFFSLSLVCMAIGGLNVGMWILILTNQTSRERLHKTFSGRRNPFRGNVFYNIYHFLRSTSIPSDFADPKIIRDWLVTGSDGRARSSNAVV